VQDWIVPATAGLALALCCGLGIALVRARSRTERALRDARADAAQLRIQVDALEHRLDRPTAPHTPVEAEFVITDFGDHDPGPAHAAPELGTALFADLVLRETVVKAASLAHGVRRALDAETRNRIRFEMKREVKRARKQRRADTRQARREWDARRRSAQDSPPGEEGTAA
jgi:hypothetical protein